MNQTHRTQGRREIRGILQKTKMKKLKKWVMKIKKSRIKYNSDTII